jgi:hypothetical protein
VAGATVTCEGCGYVGPASIGFDRIRTGWRTSVLCPGCQRAHHASTRTSATSWWNIASVAALGLTVLFLVSDGGWELAGQLLAGLVLVALGSGLLGVLHESAHALVAWLLRFRVYAVSIGSGPVVGSGHVGRAEVTFRLVPFGGVTMTATQVRRAFRLRLVAVNVAGVAIQACVVGAALWWSPTDSGGRFVRGLLIVVNLIDIVTNLWPRRVMTTAGPSLTDGGLIWSALRMTDAEIEEAIAGAGIAAALEDRPVADGDVIATLADAPIPVQRATALDLLIDGRAAESVVIFDRLVAEDPGDDAHHTLVLANNLASALLTTETRLEDADRLSARAFELAPWEAAVQATRGCVLVELQRPAEAVPMLERALIDVTHPPDRAEVEGYLALAALQRGDRFTARQHLGGMRKAAPDHRLRERVTRELAEADASAAAAETDGRLRPG